MHPQHWIYTAMRSKNWIKQHRKNWEICSWKVEVEKSPVDNRSTKPEKMGILSCQKIKKNMKKARKYGPFSLSSRPDSNRRPTHYECVALPAEPRKLIKRFALTHTLYTGFPDLASVFWKKVKLIYFWKKLEKSSWQSGGSGVLYSLSPMKLIELLKQFKQFKLLNLQKR